MPQLANQQVQLAHIETGLAIVFPGQLENGESILVGSKATVQANRRDDGRREAPPRSVRVEREVIVLPVMADDISGLRSSEMISSEMIWLRRLSP